MEIIPSPCLLLQIFFSWKYAGPLHTQAALISLVFLCFDECFHEVCVSKIYIGIYNKIHPSFVILTKMGSLSVTHLCQAKQKFIRHDAILSCNCGYLFWMLDHFIFCSKEKPHRCLNSSCKMPLTKYTDVLSQVVHFHSCWITAVLLSHTNCFNTTRDLFG